jgi:SAM-dependent methyltransferase
LFRDPAHWPVEEVEKERYLHHENHLEDQGYLAFAKPIFQAVRNQFDPTSLGLDFGCGHTPVISELLRRENFKVDDYDPFFHPEKIYQGKTYDYLICCEVIEHFHEPGREFGLMHSLLRESGKLICMTDVYSDRTDFGNWYYKNDPTHVFIYRNRTLEFICSSFGFSDVKIQGRLIEFSK